MYLEVQLSPLYHAHTLHVWSSDTSMFRAAKSLCTNSFLSRYSMPLAISLQNPRSLCGVSSDRASPGVLCGHMTEYVDMKECADMEECLRMER